MSDFWFIITEGKLKILNSISPLIRRISWVKEIVVRAGESFLEARMGINGRGNRKRNQ
jgi:hypothetical protein